MNLKAYLLCPVAKDHPLYRDWIHDCPVEACPVLDYDTNWEPPDDADLVVTHIHYRWEETSILRRIKDAGKVATLVLADGILEHRNTFENPQLPDGAMFQPLMADKLACIGRSQARIVEAWSNVGKCEVVGLPRLDSWASDLLSGNLAPREPDEYFNVLVTTARTPFFNNEQMAETVEAIGALKSWFETEPTIGEKKCQVQWRLSDELYEATDIQPDDDAPKELSDALSKCDAVLTTPSTLQLEAALKAKPVALIDFGNYPQYVPAAWTIQNASQIDKTLRQIADPSPSRLLFQETVLQDALEYQPTARKRMHQLVWEMALASRKSRESGESLKLPQRILPDEQLGFQRVAAASQLDCLFPNNAAFQNCELKELQAELSQAVSRLSYFPDAYFKQKKSIRDLHHFINWARVRLRNRNDRIRSLMKEVEELKSKLINKRDSK